MAEPLSRAATPEASSGCNSRSRCYRVGMAAPGVTLLKQMTYRGVPEEWGNTYHFVGAAPSTREDWSSLVGSLITLESQILWDQVDYTRALCYEDTDDPNVQAFDVTDEFGPQSGTLNGTTGTFEAQAGATAYMIRWDTGRMTSNGRPIYLRKYYHPGLGDPSGGDGVDAYVLAAMGDVGEDIRTGTSAWPGLADPAGNAPISTSARPFIVTRQLHKGRRRPT